MCIRDRVRCIITKNTKDKPRSFFDNIDQWAKEQGASGLAYFTIDQDKEIKGKGPVGKFFTSAALEEIMRKTEAKIGDSIFSVSAWITQNDNPQYITTGGLRMKAETQSNWANTIQINNTVYNNPFQYTPQSEDEYPIWGIARCTLKNNMQYVFVLFRYFWN